MTVQERKAELRRHAAGLPQMEAGPLFRRWASGWGWSGFYS